MTRTYETVDVDGHVLELLTLWDDYIDPRFGQRRPRHVIDENGAERISVDGMLLGNPRGIGSLGSIGVRQGEVKVNTLKYEEGRKGAVSIRIRVSSIWTPTARCSVPLSGALTLRVPSKIRISPLQCAVHITGGLWITVSRIPTGYSVRRGCCRCNRSRTRWPR